MDITTLAQTIFYLVSSVAILVVGFLLAVILYHVFRIIKNMELFSAAVKERIKNIGEKINIFAGLAALINKFSAKRASKKRSD